jgi:HEAT repeat protein
VSLETLLPQLERGTPDARLDAAVSLGELAHKKATVPLIRTLRDPDPELRGACCEALGTIGDARAVPPLVSMLRDPDEDVRGEAFSALLAIGSARAGKLPAFDGEDPANPSAALTQIAWPADLEAVSMLVEALDDADPEVRIGAAFTLGRLGVTAALGRLGRLLGADPDPDVRGAAAFALGDLADAGETRAVQALLDAWATHPTEAEVAVLIVRSLVGRAGTGMFRALQQALRHADARVKQLASMGFARLGDPAAVAPLVRALGDGDVGVRRNAALALGHLRDASAAAPLVRAAAGEVPEVKAAIVQSLRRLPGDRVAQVLGEALRAPDAAQRRAAAYLSGRVGYTAGLHEATEDPHEEVRRDATLALGSAGDVRLRPSVEARLQDAAWSVRAAAAEALRRLGDPTSVPTLRRYEGDPHPTVRMAVRAALTALGG